MSYILSNKDNMTADIEYPVLILSSHAGLGNCTVGEAINERLDINKAAAHYSIEDLIPHNMRRRHFSRYKNICFYAPWLLYIIYKIPVNYMFDYFTEMFFKTADLSILEEAILKTKSRTVICTSHRACFWASSLKRRKSMDYTLIGVLTDYYMNAGWKFLFNAQINSIYGPIDKKLIPLKYVNKYFKMNMPLKKEVYPLALNNASVNNVLITGGGWGLGPIMQIVSILLNKFSDLSIHVACGDNIGIFDKLDNNYKNDQSVRIYGKLPSLAPLMDRCGSVITKPGGVMITEAFVAKRKIFLLKGLPVTEEANAEYAMHNFNASLFSVENFSKWYRDPKNG